MLSQQNQSMTKTNGPLSPVIIPLIPSTMENANNIGVPAPGSSSTTPSPPNPAEMKIMGASVSTTNNSSNSSGCGGGGGGMITTTVGGNTLAGGRSEPGSGNAEHLPKLLNILPAVTACTYTPCYW